MQLLLLLLAFFLPPMAKAGEWAPHPQRPNPIPQPGQISFPCCTLLIIYLNVILDMLSAGIGVQSLKKRQWIHPQTLNLLISKLGFPEGHSRWWELEVRKCWITREGKMGLTLCLRWNTCSPHLRLSRQLQSSTTPELVDHCPQDTACASA
jgi:hypothetical protein